MKRPESGALETLSTLIARIRSWKTRVESSRFFCSSACRRRCFSACRSFRSSSACRCCSFSARSFDSAAFFFASSAFAFASASSASFFRANGLIRPQPLLFSLPFDAASPAASAASAAAFATAATSAIGARWSAAQKLRAGVR